MEMQRSAKDKCFNLLEEKKLNQPKEVPNLTSFKIQKHHATSWVPPKSSCDIGNVWFIFGEQFKIHWCNANTSVKVSES